VCWFAPGVLRTWTRPSVPCSRPGDAPGDPARPPGPTPNPLYDQGVLCAVHTFQGKLKARELTRFIERAVARASVVRRIDRRDNAAATTGTDPALPSGVARP